MRLVVDNVDLSNITSGLPSGYQSIPTPHSYFNHLPSRSYNLKLILSLVNIIIIKRHRRSQIMASLKTKIKSNKIKYC